MLLTSIPICSAGRVHYPNPNPTSFGGTSDSHPDGNSTTWTSSLLTRRHSPSLQCVFPWLSALHGVPCSLLFRVRLCLQRMPVRTPAIGLFAGTLLPQIPTTDIYVFAKISKTATKNFTITTCGSNFRRRKLYPQNGYNSSNHKQHCRLLYNPIP